MTPTNPNRSEPRLARIAATIGDPTRARTLARLLDGRMYTAGELGAHAGVAPATMSAHLKRLVDEGLARVRAQGRHRYFALADATVAHALEAELQVADAQAPDRHRWIGAERSGLRHARSCYGHLAGELGVRLHDALLRREWVAPVADGRSAYRLTEAGLSALSGLRIIGAADSDAARPDRSRGPMRALYDCVDWSERREHFAGPAAVRLLDGLIARGWLSRAEGSRALVVTEAGRSGLRGLLSS